MAILVRHLGTAALIFIAFSASTMPTQGQVLGNLLPLGAANVDVWKDAAKSVDLFAKGGYLGDQNPKDYVLLVPDDSAWSKIGVTEYDVQEPANKTALTKLLGCNIVSASTFSSQIASIAQAQAGSANFSTPGGCNVTASWEAGGISLKNSGNPFGFITGEEVDSITSGYSQALIINGLNQPTSGDLGVARTFSGPSMYPPADFAAYGIVAFPNRPIVKSDTDRFLAFCRAYVGTLTPTSELPQPKLKQIVTVWPIDDDGLARTLNTTSPDKICTEEAVDEYGLLTAQEAIADARKANFALDGPGPFLIAWSPATQKGAKDAVVLVFDLHLVQNYDQATREFLRWQKEVVENSALWQNGFSWDNLSDTAGLLADRLGIVLSQVTGGPQ